MNEVAAGARGNDHGEISGAAIERVVAAIGGIVPGNGAAADPRRIRIHGTGVKVDSDLPAGTTHRIGANED